MWSSTGAPTLCTPRNGSAQVDANERPRRSHQTLIFKQLFAKFVLGAPLGGCPRRGLHLENMQYRIGFLYVLDALIESQLDHRTTTPKLKNERHAAWERSGTKRNERHAAWEPFSSFYVPVGAPNDAQKNAPNHLFRIVFRHLLTQLIPRRRQSHVKHFERHAAWERALLQQS